MRRMVSCTTRARPGPDIAARPRRTGGEHAHLAQRRQIDQLCTDAVIDVVVVVGDLVGEVGDLRLKPGCWRLRKRSPSSPSSRALRDRGMLEDALPAFEREVEPAELRVALLQLIHHAQGLQVVLESAVFAHALVERILAGMAEGRMAEVMRQRRSPRSAPRSGAVRAIPSGRSAPPPSSGSAGCDTGRPRG